MFLQLSNNSTTLFINNKIRFTELIYIYIKINKSYVNSTCFEITQKHFVLSIAMTLSTDEHFLENNINRLII